MLERPYSKIEEDPGGILWTMDFQLVHRLLHRWNLDCLEHCLSEHLLEEATRMM